MENTEMENTEMGQTQAAEEQGLVLTKESLFFLTGIRKWAMFFAILGFIFIGLVLLGSIGIAIASAFGGAFGKFGGMPFGFLAFIYLIVGALYFFPVLYLLNFSTNMKKAIEGKEQSNLIKAFGNLKAHYKFVGVMTIVFMAIYIIAILIMIIVGLSGGF